MRIETRTNALLGYDATETIVLLSAREARAEAVRRLTEEGARPDWARQMADMWYPDDDRGDEELYELSLLTSSISRAIIASQSSPSAHRYWPDLAAQGGRRLSLAEIDRRLEA